MFKVINKDTNTAPFIVNFEHISHLVLLFLLSKLSRGTFKTVTKTVTKFFCKNGFYVLTLS